MAYYMTLSLPIMITWASHILCIHIFLAKDVCTKPTWSSYRHPTAFFLYTSFSQTGCEHKDEAT